MNLYFFGYSDDVVCAGSSRANLDEYYGEHLLLSNGVTIRACHGYDALENGGWYFECSDKSAILIPEVDPEDEGIEHTDERIPEGLNPSGCSPVLIVPCEEGTTIVCASHDAFKDTSPDYIFAAKLSVELNKDADLYEPLDVCAVLNALKKAGWKGGAK